MTFWSCLIIKLSLIASLNLFASRAIISEWWKSVKELHRSRWSDTTDCLSHLRRSPVKLEIPMCSVALTAQKMKFSIKDSFSKPDQICSFLWIWPHLLKKSLMENFIFCEVSSKKEVLCFSIISNLVTNFFLKRIFVMEELI